MQSTGLWPPTAPTDGAESDTRRPRAKLTTVKLIKEVAAGDLKGPRAWTSDAAVLFRERSKEINVLEASRDAGLK